MKAIRYKNRAKLFVLNGSKGPIRYEFQKDMKPNRYNGNMFHGCSCEMTGKCSWCENFPELSPQ